MSKRSNRTSVIELGGEPRINFLPPEIQERKDARRRRRSLFMLVVLVGILCGIGYVYAAQFATDRQAALESEQQRTLELLAQQAQFSEARLLASQVETTDSAIRVVSATEVFWRELMSDVNGALPAGVTAISWIAAAPSATTTLSESMDLFPIDSAVNVSITVSSSDLAAVSILLDNLAALPSVLAVSIGGVSSGEDLYHSTVNIRFSADIYENRYRDGWIPTSVPVSPVESTGDTVDDEPSGEEEGDQ